MHARVAVVGGGIYGVVIAEAVALAGCIVDLWERRDDLLAEASGQNAFRLHRGYMYSDRDTIAGLAASAARFDREFDGAIVRDVRHHYAVATASRLGADAYEARLRSFGLPFRAVDHASLLPGAVEA